MKTENNKPKEVHTCPICGAKYNNSSDLLAHKWIHENPLRR